MSEKKASREVSLEFDLEPIKASTPAQAQSVKRRYDKSKQALQAEFEAAMKVEMARAEARIRAQAGTKYAELTLRSSVKALIKSPGSTEVYNAIIERIFTHAGARESQTAIREAVGARYPTIAVTKDWNKPLPPWAMKKLATRVQASAPPFNVLRVAPGLTLAALHRQAAKAIEKQQGGMVTYSAKIGVSDEKVFVNETPFKITVNPSGGKKYKTVRFNVSALLNALQGS